MGAPYRCPICNGKGTVPPGFYSQNLDGQWSTSVVLNESCRACDGRGIVWSGDDFPHGITVTFSHSHDVEDFYPSNTNDTEQLEKGTHTHD